MTSFKKVHDILDDISGIYSNGILYIGLVVTLGFQYYSIIKVYPSTPMLFTSGAVSSKVNGATWLSVSANTLRGPFNMYNVSEHELVSSG